MPEVVHVPAELDSLFDQVSQKFDETEAENVFHEVSKHYPTKQDSFNRNDVYGAFKTLYVMGEIDDGNQRLLEILAKKASKKDEILKLICDYEESSSLPKHDLVGRDADISSIMKLVTSPRVPGINLFGDSGVGKTTLGKEVLKRMERFRKGFIDVRELSCLDSVYFDILQELDVPSWGDNKKERIYEYLEDLSTKTVLILDSVERLVSKENEEEQKTREDFLRFLEVIIASKASRKGYFKVILTSTTQLTESALKGKLFTEYNVQPFSNNVSKDFIRKRNRGEVLDVHQHKALSGIADLCRNNAYILQGAQQLMMESFPTPKDVLRKITARIEKGVPKKFACISAVFESLPSDHLRQVAVKVSLLQRPFSVSTAMKITEISSDYDAEFDLEMLVIHRILKAEDVNGKRKYDLHALFRDFVSYLCKAKPVYKEQLKRGENLYFEHFSGKLTKLANNLESEFVNTYSKLKGNRANFELAIHLSEENKETFDLLLHTDDYNQFALMGILFEVLKDVNERRQLFGKWAEAAEDQEQWFNSALMRCWQSIQGSNLEGKLNEEILKKAQTSIQKLKSSHPDYERLNEVNSLFLLCQGKIKWMTVNKLTLEQRTSDDEKLLKEGIEHLKESLELNGDSTLTARVLNLIGNCYMDLKDPLKAKEYYQKALDMKIKLVGNEKHLEIPTYYNQIAQAHEMLGRKEEEKWYKRLFGLKESARKEYGKAVKWTEKALALQEKLGVSNTDYTAIFQRNLANIFIGLEEYDKALEHAQKSFEMRNKRLGKHPETVRILYLIGVIHENKEELKAALQSYEEAFAMEESLPDDNRSVVRKMLCDRLDEMCNKLEHSFLRNDLFLYFPPKAVPKRTTVKYKVLPKDYSPSPVGAEETLVSNIVELGPNDLVIRQSIIFGLMHSGPGRDLGYETVMKAFNQDKGQWEELEELKDKSHLPEACKCDFIQVQIRKPTILAVVTRLITDRFHVTPKGCVVRSSVCRDVIVEFPEGAVDKTVEGAIKVILVDSSLQKQGYPSPILCVQGFAGIQFKRWPIVKLPQPAPSEMYSECKICVLCLEDTKSPDGTESQWKDITKDIHIEENEYLIQLHMTHFSRLSAWKWKDIPPITFISSVFEFLWSPPRNVCFAVFKVSENPQDSSIQLGLLCTENTYIFKIKESKGFSELCPKTGIEKMRIDEKAYVEIKEDFIQEGEEPVFLRFLGQNQVFQDYIYISKRKESTKKDGDESLEVSFYAEDNKERCLCKLSCKAKDIPSISGKDETYNITVRGGNVAIGNSAVLRTFSEDNTTQDHETHDEPGPSEQGQGALERRRGESRDLTGASSNSWS